jgi:hypothetical protein
VHCHWNHEILRERSNVADAIPARCGLPWANPHPAGFGGCVLPQGEKEEAGAVEPRPAAGFSPIRD